MEVSEKMKKPVIEISQNIYHYIATDSTDTNSDIETSTSTRLKMRTKSKADRPKPYTKVDCYRRKNEHQHEMIKSYLKGDRNEMKVRKSTNEVIRTNHISITVNSIWI